MIDPRDAADRLVNWGRLGGDSFKAWRSSGLSVPWRPTVTSRLARDLLVHGVSPAIGWAAGAARHPDAPALAGVDGPWLDQREAEDLTRAATTYLRAAGLEPGSTAALLGRNSVGFAIAIAAVARTGADLVYLNPGFSAAQVADVCDERGVSLVLADPDLSDRAPTDRVVLDLADPSSWSTADAGYRISPSGGRHIILTSGTTGRPKGADRSRTPLEAAVSLLSALPYRERGTHVLAAPLFHSWGWLNHRLAALLDAGEVLVPRPDAATVLDAAEQQHATLIITTPVVIGRLAEAGPGGRDLSQLSGVLVSGSAIPPDVVARFADQFGPVLYNLYGSTEVGYASVAAPADLAAAPDTAGRALPGVRLSIRSSDGKESPPGRTGEVWVGSAAAFDGYVDGADKPRDDGLVATGDLGLLDETGLLFIRGRADDLIISGGENVHPTEVESVLRGCPAVVDVAAVGRPDSVYGQAVVAFVVSDAATTPATVRRDVMAYAREHLAPYQRPQEVRIVDHLPRNETGKVVRRLLPL